jgi:AcrR family transcriptional regulator
MVQTTKRLSGRPRSADADRAILDAALRLMLEQGLARMTMEGVAAAAGVGKTTIYRRYPSKRELVVAVVEQLVPVADLPEFESAHDGLLAIVRLVSQILATPRGARLVLMMLAEQGSDPEMLAFFRSKVILPRRALLRGILQRGMDQGEIRPDLDPELMIDMLVGAFIAHHVAGLPMDDGWGGRLVETAWRAMSRTSSSLR